MNEFYFASVTFITKLVAEYFTVHKNLHWIQPQLKSIEVKYDIKSIINTTLNQMGATEVSSSRDSHSVWKAANAKYGDYVCRRNRKR